MAVDDEWDLLDIMDSDGTGLEHEAREDNWDAVECDVESSGDVVVVVTICMQSMQSMQSKKAFSDVFASLCTSLHLWCKAKQSKSNQSTLTI